MVPLVPTFPPMVTLARMVPLATEKCSGFSGYQWYHWLPMVPLVKFPMVPLGEFRTHAQFDYTLHQQRLEQVQSTKYLGLLSHMTWIGVNTFQKFQLRQLRQWVFFGAIWPLPLGTLRKLHTKHWFAQSSSMQHLFGIPIMNLRLDRWRRCRGQLPGGPAGDGGTPVASAICLTTLSGHPWRPGGSSLP